MKINLSKKNYVISAGADGLGFAIANKIINSGGKVYLSDINKSKVDKINSNKKYRNKIFASTDNPFKYLISIVLNRTTV